MLIWEVELLKIVFVWDVYWEVLEQDKVGDVVVFQVLMMVQFEILLLLFEMFNMSEEEVIIYVKGIISCFLEIGYLVVFYVVKLDGFMMFVELFFFIKCGIFKCKKLFSVYNFKFILVFLGLVVLLIV